MKTWRSVVALSGGVGGARLVDGLAAHLAPQALAVVVNTGDDFVHWGLTVSPDIDTVMYTLSGLADEQRGWGLANETFHALEGVAALGGETWFRLGDRDLATHIVRTEALARGESLTEVTARLCRAVGVRHQVLPMADEPRRTMIDTRDGETLPFQDWFVRRRAAPEVARVWFDGTTRPSAAVLAALQDAELVVIAPSNPYVSVDPIATLEGVRDVLAAKPVVSVSPIVGGRAVKGPLAKMIRHLAEVEPSAAAVVAHYKGLVDGAVVERGDGAAVSACRVLETGTIMRGRDDRARLAAEVLAFGETFE